MFPTRYTDLAEARKKHGPRADQLAAYFYAGDPLADELAALLASYQTGKQAMRMLDRALAHGGHTVAHAPKPLRDFLAHVEDVPVWVNWDLLALGGRTFQRCSSLCGLLLGCCCLPVAYRSGAGTQPLARTKKMEKRSEQRLRETMLFFVEVCKPDGLKRQNAGWERAVRVRLYHAYIRRLLHQDTKIPWQQHDWGVPINQVDLIGTQTLFCVSLLRHLRQLGFHFTAEESAGVMHLWRYAGHLLGIVPELLCASEVEGRHLQEMLLDLTGDPNPDSHRLTEMLMKTALPKMALSTMASLMPRGISVHRDRSRERLVRLWQSVASAVGLGPEASARHLAAMSYGLSHATLGGRVAADLRYPRTHWRYTAPLVLRCLVTPLETFRRFVPGGTRLAVWFGATYVERLLKDKMFASHAPQQPPK